MACFHLLVLALGIFGCTPLPDVEYETERLSIAPDFDHPICAGTLQALDDHVTAVEAALARTPDEQPILVYWLEDGVDGLCSDSQAGCFYPGTRVVFARGTSITHEIVHAIMDAVGENFFLKEGLAELYSGVGVSHRPRAHGDELRDNLRISGRAYRDGAVNYAEAGHFTAWIQRVEGDGALQQITSNVQDEAGAGTVQKTIERVTGESLDDLMDRYRRTAPRYLPGLNHDEVPLIDMIEASAGARRFLDCSSTETRGPHWDGRAGMYRVEQLFVPRATAVRLSVVGDSDTFVEVFDPTASAGSGAVPDWTMPASVVDPDAIRLEPGMSLETVLDGGNYLVVYGSEDTTDAEVELRMQPAASPQPDPRTWVRAP